MSHPADHPGPLIFVDDLDAPVLDRDDAHHLRRVLRVRPGDPLTLADGAGQWWTARRGDQPEPTSETREQPAPAPALTVGFALVKGSRPELAVQKLCELGIDRIIPFRADRSVVRWDDATAVVAVARLRSVARAAAMQSHRPRLPVVDDVTDLAPLTALPGVALADRSGAPPTLRSPSLLVGPEGGWSDEERALG